MSVIGLAAAINKDMFETIYEACPSTLLNSLNDDVTPLWIAAMKDDKNLFFRLIELGFNVSINNDYTYCMMKQSIVPEIKNLAKYFDIDDYWNGNSDNILIENEPDNKDCLPVSKLVNENNSNKSPLNVHKIRIVTFDTTMCNKFRDKSFRKCSELFNFTHIDLYSERTVTYLSKYIYFTQIKHNEEVNLNIVDGTKDKQLFVNEDEDEVMLTCSKSGKNVSEQPLQRLQFIRPQDLNIQYKEDLDTTVEYVPEFSPLRQQNIPPNTNDENVFGENTPAPPRYRTPPRRVILTLGLRVFRIYLFLRAFVKLTEKNAYFRLPINLMGPVNLVLNSEEAKMFVLRKHYGLGQYVPIFLEQEVDIDLFMTLANEDLIEIGIKNEADRKATLEVINRS